MKMSSEQRETNAWFEQIKAFIGRNIIEFLAKLWNVANDQFEIKFRDSFHPREFFSIDLL